jgi:hypothetical protein
MEHEGWRWLLQRVQQEAEGLSSRHLNRRPRPDWPRSRLQKPIRKDDPDQSKAFIEKAREIGADEKRSAADKLMERLAKTKPEPRKRK